MIKIFKDPNYLDNVVFVFEDNSRFYLPTKSFTVTISGDEKEVFISWLYNGGSVINKQLLVNDLYKKDGKTKYTVQEIKDFLFNGI